MVSKPVWHPPCIDSATLGGNMNRHRLNNFEMITHVVSFGKRNRTLFPKESAAEEILEAVESDVETLKAITNSAFSSSTTVRATIKTKIAARTVLTDALARASRMCREFESVQLELPRNRMRDTVLVA